MLAAERSLVTVEEVVDELEPRAGAIVLPGWAVDAVAVAPGGSQPSYAAGYSTRDNDFYCDVGRDLARPRPLHGLDGGARARGGGARRDAVAR